LQNLLPKHHSMSSDTRSCQNCKKDFVILHEDFLFYEKVKVPPPTFCPQCRLQRRLAWRAERGFHHRKCDLCAKDIIATFPQDTEFPVYCRECWWSDKWDGKDYGREYDWNKSFFQQFYELQQKVPAIALQVVNSVNCDFTNQILDCKNCYLLISAGWDEDCYYSYRILNSKNIFDSSFLLQCENCYQCVEGIGSSHTLFSQNVVDSLDISFCYDVRGSQNCFMSSNLRNASYIFRNRKLSKHEYEEALKTIDFGSSKNIQQYKQEFNNLLASSVHAYADIKNTLDSTGQILTNTKDCKSCFGSSELENCSYCLYIDGAKDSMDITIGTVELGYEISTGGVKSANIKLSADVWPEVHDITYCASCRSSANLFGCIGLKKDQYCVLNKQYSKEEYERLLPKIVEQMNAIPYVDSRNRVYKYGEFFPIQFSYLPYNESPAQDYFPMTKNEALRQGYTWRDEGERSLKITKLTDDLPDHINNIDESILHEVIECEHQAKCNERCTNAFRVILTELKFYKAIRMALPRLCPNCRNRERLSRQNPINLWHRKCMCQNTNTSRAIYQNKNVHSHGSNPCVNEFETSYSPERPETIYCKSCYQTEVI